MKIKTILVPTDFSELSNEAVEFALSLAKEMGSKVILLSSLTRSDDFDEFIPLYDEGYSYSKDRAAAVLSEIIKKAQGMGLEAGGEIVDGTPFVEIIRMAQKMAADLIVMGTHGRTGLSHVVMGSQAERVVRHSCCPVLTVKSRRHQFSTG